MIHHYGREFLDDPRLNLFHRLYIWIFGIPVSGLRIRLRTILPKIHGKFTSIVDLGCGRGVFTFELARKFPQAEVVGIDIDENQIKVNHEIARKRRYSNLRFEVADILKVDGESQFDLALSVDNLEHIENDIDALRNIRKRLKTGGLFVCHVPARERVWLFGKMAPNFAVPGHVRPGYRLQELKDRLETAGFQVHSIVPTYGYLETVSNNFSYLITGAREKNALIYALVFPVLNFIAWLGRGQNPGSRGAGVLAFAFNPDSAK